MTQITIDLNDIAFNFQKEADAIKTAEDFAPEISRIVRTNLTDLRLNLAFNHNEEIDWSTCDSEKVANIRRKIKVIVSSENGEVIDQAKKRYR